MVLEKLERKFTMVFPFGSLSTIFIPIILLAKRAQDLYFRNKQKSWKAFKKDAKVAKILLRRRVGRLSFQSKNHKIWTKSQKIEKSDIRKIENWEKFEKFKIQKNWKFRHSKNRKLRKIENSGILKIENWEKFEKLKIWKKNWDFKIEKFSKS